jgi:hypothetical protein
MADDVVLIPGPPAEWTRDVDLGTRDSAQGHVADLVLVRALTPAEGHPASWCHDAGTIVAEVARLMAEGCRVGPWERLTAWEQETAVAVARRAARAMVARFED